MERQRAIYRERTSWPGWIWVVLWGTIFVATVAAVAEGDAWAPVFLVGVGAAVHWLVGGLTVRLHRDHIAVGLGRARLIRSTIRYEHIQGVEAVRYSPLREFGGWGYRIRGNRRAWTARGDEAVVLDLRDGRQIYIGTESPDRLRERILTIGGQRIG